jgi:hypothetical protein
LGITKLCSDGLLDKIMNKILLIVGTIIALFVGGLALGMLVSYLIK